MTEEPKECKCSICKRNKGATQGAMKPSKKHTPVPMMIRSIRIDQKRHRISNLGMIQEEEPPNRRTPENSSEKAKTYQREERGEDTEQQKQDKSLTGIREQGTPCPISFIPHITHYPLMHGSPSEDCQQCPICRNPSSSASSLTTVSGVDTIRMPCLPCTPPSSATVEAVPILSETLWTTPSASIPATTTSTDTDRACVIRRAHEEPSSTSAKRASSSEILLADQDASWHLSAAEDPQTQEPLNHDETAIMVRLPQHPSYLVPCTGPVTHTCRSSPQPANIVLQAPCDLSLPWINQLTFHYTGVYRMHNEY